MDNDLNSIPAFRLEFNSEKTEAEIFFSGNFVLTAENADNFHIDLQKELEGINSLKINFSEIKNYDSFLASIVRRIKKYCSQENIKLEYSAISENLQSYLISVIRENPKSIIPESMGKRKEDYFTIAGKITLSILADLRKMIEFAGELFINLINIFIRPGEIRWKDLPYHFLRSGVGAFPIVFLIVFLIGVITGYQGSLQLKQFGADIYIADLIGISITRELAPLMTAIIVSGRSGSAFAAEIGTMKVSEEIDALHSMGFDHMKFLVVPRVLSVILAMPLLTVMADFAGIGGGLLSSISTLDITMSGYINELSRVLTYADIFSGLGKSVVFGFIISSIGCFRGMQVKGGAESVGIYTTSSVVSGIFLIILFDALFTFLFRALGI